MLSYCTYSASSEDECLSYAEDNVIDDVNSLAFEYSSSLSQCTLFFDGCVDTS